MRANYSIGSINWNLSFYTLFDGKTLPIVQLEHIPQGLCYPLTHTPIFSRIFLRALSVMGITMVIVIIVVVPILFLFLS